MARPDIVIDGQRYVVLSDRPSPALPGRATLRVRKPKGSREYIVVRYENGHHSRPVASPFKPEEKPA